MNEIGDNIAGQAGWNFADALPGAPYELSAKRDAVPSPSEAVQKKLTHLSF